MRFRPRGENFDFPFQAPVCPVLFFQRRFCLFCAIVRHMFLLSPSCQLSDTCFSVLHCSTHRFFFPQSFPFFGFSALNFHYSFLCLDFLLSLGFPRFHFSTRYFPLRLPPPILLVPLADPHLPPPVLALLLAVTIIHKRHLPSHKACPYFASAHSAFPNSIAVLGLFSLGGPELLRLLQWSVSCLY